MSMGNMIRKLRTERGMTQEALAERMDVSFQTVSGWEKDQYLPETQKIPALAEALGVHPGRLFDDEGKHGWEKRSRLFDEEHMYTYMRANAGSADLRQLTAMLPVARKMHEGQFRKSISGTRVPYIAHPLTLVCHAWSLGVRDDDLLTALLLHDTMEDCGADLDAMDISDRVKKTVRLVSYNTYPGKKEDIRQRYYDNIAADADACAVKCFDRCNNLSCMAMGFTEAKMAEYVTQTEKYVMPLFDTLKNDARYVNIAFVLKYQILALLEMCKRFLRRRIKGEKTNGLYSFGLAYSLGGQL